MNLKSAQMQMCSLSARAQGSGVHRYSSPDSYPPAIHGYEVCIHAAGDEVQIVCTG